MSASAHSMFEELRQKAEEMLRHNESSFAYSGLDILPLIHELEVHQIELQLQNEELNRARGELEEARQSYSDLYNYAPAGYVSIAGNGIIDRVNFMAEELLRTNRKELIGRAFSQWIHPVDQAEYFGMIRLSDGSEARKRTGEIRVLRLKTVPFHARVEISPSLDGSGAVNGWFIVFVDISESKEAEAQLKHYAEQLEHSNRELQDFAFIASHDLHEPLRKIQAFGDQLKRRFADSLGPEGAECLDRMCNAARRLQDMVRGLLDYSRVITLGGDFDTVDLELLVQDVLVDLEWQIKAAGATVTIQDLPGVQADPTQMRQLFQNLISNALKFHGEDPTRIRIHGNPGTVLKNGKEYWELFVEDNGIGFKQKDAERIFSLFERLHGRSSPYEGTGMGLAICKRIVERHGGTIAAAGHPGKGATFTISFPADRHRSIIQPS